MLTCGFQMAFIIEFLIIRFTLNSTEGPSAIFGRRIQHKMGFPRLSWQRWNNHEWKHRKEATFGDR